ncbi:GNAT family N-acetyltransferase [uncultured Maribacter sp.]|uniref:GNAT family N-acetyltransferase n=1 Tax=uncultured Maribacter sp. TaxID=431308 RepID=UPI00261413D8|nr:GNAT family N-acetyltransferase [uncultured Maribacter sp.]
MKKESLEIREATIKDLSILTGFEQEVIRYERPFAPNLKEDPISYYNIKNFIEQENTYLVVAVINHEIVGSGYALIKDSAVYKKPAKYAYLGFMYVMPSHRGKGINGKIIDSLINWSQKRRIHEIQLDVYAENDSAIKAYKKRGFKPDLLKMRFNSKEEN